MTEESKKRVDANRAILLSIIRCLELVVYALGLSINPFCLLHYSNRLFGIIIESWYELCPPSLHNFQSVLQMCDNLLLGVHYKYWYQYWYMYQYCFI